VWLVASRNTASLLAFRDFPHREAAKGVHGQGKGRHGARGDDTVVPVPEGTVVLGRDGSVLADLVHDGDRYLAAKGGQGGKGNSRFLSNRRRAPSFAEQGEVGEEFYLNLELKLMADVALVGFPNAGKSTLISRISAAKPKIANYPFTTLEPHLGVVRIDDREFVVADIPGLIEGAAEGKGLGHQFLRHIERARALVVLIDLAPMDERAPDEQLSVLLAELERYQPSLLERPRLVVGAKGDAAVFDWEGDTISAVTGDGIRPLIGRLADLVDQARATAVTASSFVVHRPEPAGISVTREDDASFVVHGRAALRAVALNDLTNPEALAHVQDRLKRLGVDKALAKAGAQEGDEVHIGTFAFEYQES
ncbi:MAG: Obg family GTPase CgtA, partial [Acidimicrobiales bacterium]